MESKRSRGETKSYMERRSYGKKQKMDPENINKRKTPAYIPPNAVILDNGAHSIKIGYSKNESPVVFPNCIMKAKSEKKRFFICDQIEDCHDLSGLYYLLPHEKGYITKYDIQKTIWDYAFNKFPITDETVVMTQPLFNFKNTQEYMDEIFFEEYEVKSLYRANGTDFSYYNYKKRIGNANTSCLVVDSGHSFTHIVPYINGKKYPSAIIRMDVGGKLLTNYLKDIISYRQLHVMEETYVINQVKEDVCYMALDFKKEMTRAKMTNDIVKNYVLPDFHNIRRGYIQEPDDKTIVPDNCQILRLNNERISVPEIIMKPSIIPGIEQAGLAQCIFKSINKCPKENRAALTRNIVLTGGNCEFAGFKSRVEGETRMFMPCEHRLSIYQPTNPGNYAWHGAKKLSADPILHSISVTKQEYDESGSNLTFERFNSSFQKTLRSTDRHKDEEPKKFSYLEHLQGIDLFKKKTHPNALRKPDVEFILEGEDIEKFDHQYVTLEIDNGNKRKVMPMARIRLTEEVEDEQFHLRQIWEAKRKKRMLFKAEVMASTTLTDEMKLELLGSESSDSSDDRVFDEILTSDETGLRKSPVKIFTPVFRKPTKKIDKLRNSERRRALRKKLPVDKAETSKLNTKQDTRTRASQPMPPPLRTAPLTRKTKLQLRQEARHLKLEAKRKLEEQLRLEADAEKMLKVPEQFVEQYQGRMQPRVNLIRSETLPIQVYSRLGHIHIQPKDTNTSSSGVESVIKSTETTKHPTMVIKSIETTNNESAPDTNTCPIDTIDITGDTIVNFSDTNIIHQQETITTIPQTITKQIGSNTRPTIMRPTHTIILRPIQSHPFNTNQIPALRPTTMVRSATVPFLRPHGILRPIAQVSMLRPVSQATVLKSGSQAPMLRTTAQSSMLRPVTQVNMLRTPNQATMPRASTTHVSTLRPAQQTSIARPTNTTVIRSTNTSAVRPESMPRSIPLRPIQCRPQTHFQQRSARPNDNARVAEKRPEPIAIRPVVHQQRTTQVILSTATLNPSTNAKVSSSKVEGARNLTIHSNQQMRTANNAGPNRCVTINSSQLLSGPVSRGVSLISTPLVAGTPTTRSININSNQIIGSISGVRTVKGVSYHNSQQHGINPSGKSININANQLIGGPTSSKNINADQGLVIEVPATRSVNINANQVIGNAMQLMPQTSTNSKNLTVQLIPFNSDLIRQSGSYIITSTPNNS